MNGTNSFFPSVVEDKLENALTVVNSFKSSLHQLPKDESNTIWEEVNKLKRDIVKELSFHAYESCRKDLKSLLGLAVENDDAELVEVLLFRENQTHFDKLLVQKCVRSNESWPQGWSVLHVAVNNNSYKTVKLLFRHHAAVNEVITRGGTALHIAAEKGFIEIADLLLKNGAAVEAKHTVFGYFKAYTPLHMAAKVGHADIVKLLLKHKADVDAKAENGLTPLHVAIEEGHFEVAEYLLEVGASIFTKRRHNCIYKGYTPLHDTVLKGNLQFTKLLLSRNADLNVTAENGSTLLHVATERGHFEMTEFLLEIGASVNAKLTDCPLKGYTPLHNASLRGDVEMVKLLLSHNADINVKEDNGLSALHVASREGHYELVKYLLENGASLDTIHAKGDFLGYTPLHDAVKNKHEKIVGLLLKYDSTLINKKSDFNIMPLYLAILPRNSKTLEILLQYGAEVNVTSFMHGMLPGFLLKSPDSSEQYVIRLVVQYLVKKRAEKLHVSRDSLQWLSGKMLKKVRRQCEIEIKKMQRLSLGESNVTYFDILTSSGNKLAAYMRNEDVVQVLESGEFSLAFPNYANLLQKKIDDGRERRDLLQQSSEILSAALNKTFEFPCVCVEKIVSYLPYRALRNVIRSKPSRDDASETQCGPQFKKQRVV